MHQTRDHVGRVTSLLGVLAVACATLIVPPARAFTLLDGATNGTPSDPSDDLQDAARWSAESGSLVDDAVRGLGGGIEYSIAADFCAQLAPRFVDSPRPNCAEIHAAVRRSFERWAEGHPALRFIDVSDRVSPSIVAPEQFIPWLDNGAEVDVFALAMSAPFGSSTSAVSTNVGGVSRSPLGTNGRLLPGRTLMTVDIVVNLDSCFYFSPDASDSACNHFESLMLHSAGHAIGLGDPLNPPGRNFDSDSDPSNAIPINCKEPQEGLKLSDDANTTAVMVAPRAQPAAVRMELSPDDVGGRDFLYPVCPGQYS